MKVLTIRDLKLTTNKLQKFALEVFAGNDETKKVQLLEKLEKIMNPNATISIKRPIEVADNVSKAKRLKLAPTKVPNEIWMKIMSYMKNRDIFGSFALVNKHFHNLTQDPSALKYLHIQDNIDKKDKAKTNYKKWLNVVKRSRTMVELKIKAFNYSQNWNHLVLETLKNNYQSMKSLTLISVDTKCCIKLSPSVTETLNNLKICSIFKLIMLIYIQKCLMHFAT